MGVRRSSRNTMRMLTAVVVVGGLLAAACADDGDDSADGESLDDTESLDDSESLDGSGTFDDSDVTTTSIVGFFFEDDGILDEPLPSEIPVPVEQGVVTSHPLATEAGIEVLAEGGSAVDAAIAIQAVLGLVEPQKSGLGGGGFMVHYDAESEVVTAYDGRGEAPAGASAGMFLVGGVPLDFATASSAGTAVSTPGVVAMLALAHDDHGELRWSELFEPAIRHASRGFTVSASLAEAVTLVQPVGASDEFLDLFTAGSGDPLRAGDLFVNADYAATVTAIADDPRALYDGEIAAEIVTAAGAAPRPGTLDEADLAGYEARAEPAVCRPYREFVLCGASPPDAGGIGVLSLMGQLEETDIASLGPSGAGWHLFVEASQRAHADVEAYVADDRAVTVPVDELLDESYIASRAASIDPTAASVGVEAGQIDGVQRGDDNSIEPGGGSSHFVVVDRDGNVVSMTSGLGSVFGSRRVAAGVVLDNQLSAFAFDPAAGGVAVANAAAPGKRPRTTMAPVVVLDGSGDVLVALGSAGGSSMMASVARSLVGVLDWGLSAPGAVALPDIVARGGTVSVEAPPATPSLLDSLTELGHVVEVDRTGAGVVQLVEIGFDGTVVPYSDPRGEGATATGAD